MKTDFIGAAYTSRSRSIDCQECINLYPEIEQGTSKNVVALIGTPGLKPFHNSSLNYLNRGLHRTSTNRLIQICGTYINEIGRNGSLTQTLGYVDTVSGICNMVDNGRELLIVDGSYGYIVDLNLNTTSKIVEEGFPTNPSHCMFINGRFVVNQGSTQTWFYSTLWYGLDPINQNHWDTLSNYQAEGSPDTLLAISSLHNEIWLFGDQTTEVWFNTGNSEDPFQRVSSAFLNIGTSAPYSVATNGNAIFWIGSSEQGDGIVWMSTSYQPQRISTHAIEFLIKSYGNIADAVGYTYQQEGHSFYMLNFPTADKTLCYDLSTGLWHTRTTYNSRTNTENRHKGLLHAFFDNKNLVSDYNSGNIYQLDLDTFKDNGDWIIRTRSTPHNHSENKRVRYNSFEIDMEKGVGLTNGTGSQPYATLQCSNDGGYTWGKELPASIGKIGERKTRLKWRRLGMARDRVLKFKSSFPVKTILIDAFMEAEIEKA